MKNLKLILALFLFSQITFAQEMKVTGIVKDSTGLPLPGVNVLVKGTFDSVQTNIDGNYSIKAKLYDTLVFSFTGYKDKRIKASETEINVILAGNIKLKEINGPAYYPHLNKKSNASTTLVKELTNKQNIESKRIFRNYKSALEQTTFLDLLKRKENKKAKIIFNGFTNRNLQECSFNETVYSTVRNKSAEKKSYLFQTIDYHFGNQKLYFKRVSFYDVNGEFLYCYNIEFYRGTKILEDLSTKKTWRFDKKEKLVQNFTTDSYNDEKIIEPVFEKLKSAIPKLKEIRDTINKILGKADLEKPYEEFSVNDWETLNKISHYLKTELNMERNLYYQGMDSDLMGLISEDGEYYEFSLFYQKVENIDYGYYLSMKSKVKN